MIDELGCEAYFINSWSCCMSRMSESATPAASVTQLCLLCCSAQVSDVLCFSSHWSQGFCVESDEAVLGEIWSASYFTINGWCLISILTCACIGFMHIWLLYWSWAHMLLWFQCASVTRSVSSDLAVIHDLGCAACSSSTDVVFWPSVSVSSHHTQQVSLHQARRCACIGCMHIWALYWNCAHMLLWFQCTSVTKSVSSNSAVIDDLGCATYLSSTDDVSDHVVPVSSHHTQQVSPTCACIDVLHIYFLHFVPVHIGHKACVSSQMKQCLVSWDLHHDSKSADDVFTSVLTCACIGFMHIWLLYWSWAHMLLWFQCAFVSATGWPLVNISSKVGQLLCATYTHAGEVLLLSLCARSNMACTMLLAHFDWACLQHVTRYSVTCSTWYMTCPYSLVMMGTIQLSTTSQYMLMDTLLMLVALMMSMLF